MTRFSSRRDRVSYRCFQILRQAQDVAFQTSKSRKTLDTWIYWASCSHASMYGDSWILSWIRSTSYIHIQKLDIPPGFNDTTENWYKHSEGLDLQLCPVAHQLAKASPHENVVTRRQNVGTVGRITDRLRPEPYYDVFEVPNGISARKSKTVGSHSLGLGEFQRITWRSSTSHGAP